MDPVGAVLLAAAFAELWGAAISRELGRTQTDHVTAPSAIPVVAETHHDVIGVHLNLIPGAAATVEPRADELASLDPAERERTRASWKRTQEWNRDRPGYADIQSTRPQTLAYGLTDSPIGQLAWIAEKFKEWTDSQGREEDVVDRDRLLTNVMLYWCTRTAGSSARIYYERAHADYWGTPPEPSTAPTALAAFPHENFIPLRRIAEATNNIGQWSELSGADISPLEVPDLLVGDIRTFFRMLRTIDAAR